jgi:hypothetical protein
MKRTSLPLQRREFITLLGGAAAAAAVLSSLAARTQTPAIIGMIPRQFARAFGNDRFQGLEPYPSIAALVQFSVVKPCAPSGVR